MGQGSDGTESRRDEMRPRAQYEDISHTEIMTFARQWKALLRSHIHHPVQDLRIQVIDNERAAKRKEKREKARSGCPDLKSERD